MNNKSLHAQVVEFIGATGKALEASRALAAAELERQEKTAAAVPVRVEQLLKAKLIEPEERKLAEEKLATHLGALEVIGGLVRRLQKQAAELARAQALQGQGKAASAAPEPIASTQDNYVGRRYGSGQVPESWKAFEERLGI